MSFDYLIQVGLVKKLYEKYPEVKEKWNDAIWLWEDDWNKEDEEE